MSEQHGREPFDILDVDVNNLVLTERLAEITFEAFKESSPNWLPTIDLAREQVLAAVSRGRLARVITQQGQVQGWIGVIKRRYLWEIHPIAVAFDRQCCGLGHLLVEDIAQHARAAGVLTLFAGTSDEVGTTNLFGKDLYTSPVDAIKNLQPTGRNAYQFWLSAGFTVVGLMPDEEGPGKHGIHLARRL